MSSSGASRLLGFGSRSKITTRLEMPPNLDRLPSEIEIALFRILQESLTNVHRHSGTKKVEVRLRRDDANVSLEIEDHGKGIAKELLEHLGKSGANVGVGLAGMRERVAELGGTFEIRSGKKGTCLTARIPVPQRVADDTSSSYSARAASNHPVA